MRDPIYDRWTKEELIGLIQKRAAVYVPEWKFDAEDADAGTAFAYIFAELFYKNLEKCSRIPEKLRRSFFAQTDLVPIPSALAEGYVTFSLSSQEFGGTLLPAGTTVLASGAADGDDIVYETTEPVYVTPAQHVCTVYTDGEADVIEYRDVLKPYTPFAAEGENSQEHVLYLAQDEALDVGGDATVGVRLDQMEKGVAREKAAADSLSWLADKKKASIAYASQTGFVEFGERTVSDGFLMLAKCAGGPEPERTELFGKESYWMRIRCRMPWKGEPFFVRDIRLKAEREGMEPDLIYNTQGEQMNVRFLPFGEMPTPFGECYFASKEALGKAGAKIRLTFRLDYEHVPFDNSVPVEREWKVLMKRSDFVPDAEYDITIERVVWEYYNGSGFRRLYLGDAAETVFNGTNTAEGDVTMEFACPPDIGLLEWQGAPTRYIRVRILKMENLYRLKGKYITPVIRDVRFSYHYGSEGVHPDYAVAKNGTGQMVFPVNVLRKGDINQQMFFGLNQKQRSLYLGFDRPIGEGPVRIFFQTEQNLQKSMPQILFEYSAREGFAALPVSDGTRGLKKSGSLVIMGKEDFSKTVLFGKSAYWIRMTDKNKAYSGCAASEEMPRITGMYLNTVKVRAAQEGSGEKGNRPAGGIDRLGGAYGYVSRVTNHLPVCGGEEKETVSEMLLRGSSMLRHGGRAVTASDFEALAREASRAVCRVKCYTGCNAIGAREPGAVTLVVLMRDFENGDLYFDRLRRRIEDMILPRMDGTLAARGQFYVTKPQFGRVNCHVKAVTADMGRLHEVKRRIESRLEQFLHPINGNYDGNGWEIGTVPNDAQLENALKELGEISFIREVRSTVERVSASSKDCGEMRFAMAVNGRHTVEVEIG